MKFLLISSHAGGAEVPESEKDAHMKAFLEWLQMINPSAALRVHGGATVTAKSVEDYRGSVAGALVFEKDPSNRADNRTVVTWHGWSPFQQW